VCYEEASDLYKQLQDRLKMVNEGNTSITLKNEMEEIVSKLSPIFNK
jgi:hypothetical protein